MNEQVSDIEPGLERAMQHLRSVLVPGETLASAGTARADDYALELIPDCGHFIADELPELVRERLVAVVREFATG